MVEVIQKHCFLQRYYDTTVVLCVILASTPSKYLTEVGQHSTQSWSTSEQNFVMFWRRLTFTSLKASHMLTVLFWGMGKRGVLVVLAELGLKNVCRYRRTTINSRYEGFEETYSVSMLLHWTTKLGLALVLFSVYLKY